MSQRFSKHLTYNKIMCQVELAFLNQKQQRVLIISDYTMAFYRLYHLRTRASLPNLHTES